MDLALRLLKQGYDATACDRQARGGGADFPSRLLGKPALVVRSEEGARAFYDESLVARADLVPSAMAWLLFGRGAVHGLDGTSHRRRKLMFIDVLSADRLGPAVRDVEERLLDAVPTWNGRVVDVHDELVLAYGRAVLTWAGIGLPSDVAAEVSRCLASIVDGFGFAGAAYARAWRARVTADRWARTLVRRVRDGQVAASEGSALATIAASDLDDATAGVELLNVLRPTVAVAWLGAFAAVRLAEVPAWRPRLVGGAAADGLAFAQEVRRTTPFAPVLAARVVRAAQVGANRVSPGELLVLDVIGIHRDEQRWPEPDVFAPERFAGHPGAFDLVPQGGGHPAGHRCPGESLALRLLAVTATVLAEVDYEVVDARVDRTRIPTLPGGGPRLHRVHAPVLR